MCVSWGLGRGRDSDSGGGIRKFRVLFWIDNLLEKNLVYNFILVRKYKIIISFNLLVSYCLMRSFL